MPKRSRDYVAGLIEDLADPIRAAHYVNAALEESEEMFLLALRDVAESHRMAKVAEEAGMSREALYRTLSEQGNPRFRNLKNLLEAMGLRIRIESTAGEPAADEVLEASRQVTQQVSATEMAQQNPTRPVALLAKLTDKYSQRSKGLTGMPAYANY